MLISFSLLDAAVSRRRATERESGTRCGACHRARGKVKEFAADVCKEAFERAGAGARCSCREVRLACTGLRSPCASRGIVSPEGSRWYDDGMVRSHRPGAAARRSHRAALRFRRLRLLA